MDSSVVNSRDAEGSVEIACLSCEAVFRLRVASFPADAEAPACPTCGFRPEPLPGQPERRAPRQGEPVGACWICGSDEHYVQKDFNRAVGLWIVVGSFIVIFLVMLIYGHLWGLYLLFALAIADALVYRCLPNVSVCYLCHSIYRGYPLPEGARGFYLGLEEKHKALRQRWLAAQERRAGGDLEPAPGGTTPATTKARRADETSIGSTSEPDDDEAGGART